jgi:hypothetical protein
MSLATPTKTVQKLQTSLQTKAKAEPAFRFYALWDKVCRANGGAPGIDGISFDKIEARGRKQWLEGIMHDCAAAPTARSPC